jgi:hypothetical protein
MASYGSLPIGTNNTRSTDNHNHNDQPNATESTQLLPNSNGYPQAPTSRRGAETDRVTINDILEEEEGAFLPLLTKSTAPLGIEAEPVPALAIAPNEHGDSWLPRDDTLRYTAKDDDEETTELRFHGGVTTYQFWMIFAGARSFCYIRLPRSQKLIVCCA